MIEVYGDITEERYLKLCDQHSTVIVNGNIITREMRDEKKHQEEKIEADKIKAMKSESRWLAAIFILMILCFIILGTLK